MSAWRSDGSDTTDGSTSTLSSVVVWNTRDTWPWLRSVGVQSATEQTQNTSHYTLPQQTDKRMSNNHT